MRHENYCLDVSKVLDNTGCVSKNIFFIGMILAASGLVSPPVALVGGIIYGFSFVHPFHLAARQLSKLLLQASAAGKACSYTLALWKKLTRFLEYPELELSTNIAENSMRPIATGRKNWIHIGSEQAGPRVAAILSVVESCRRLKIPVRDYLADILPGLANTSIHRIANLTPSAWAENHR